MPEINAFDWTVIVVVLLSSVMGFVRGIIREVFTALAIVGAALGVLLYLRSSASFSLLGFIDPAWLEVVATSGLVFLLIFIVISIATKSLAALLHKSAEIGALDRGAGLAYGFVRAALIAVLSVVLARHVTPPDRAPPPLLTQAQLYPVLERGAQTLEIFIQDKRHIVEDRVQKALDGRPEDAEQ